VDRDYTMLKVYGNTAKDNIKIQRTAYTYSATCDFDAWFTSAQIANLYMYGQGSYDVVSGSDNGDSSLQAESVNGYGGNDHILLTYTAGYTPIADGGTGHDTIVGTAYADWIWGGDDNDTIYGLGGDDELGGAAGDDTIEGGTGDDWIEGGSGDDWLYGEDDCDRLFGQSDYDYCYCGNNGKARPWLQRLRLSLLL
jgi:Ca2+-binding RTX toxin-like protein